MSASSGVAKWRRYTTPLPQVDRLALSRTIQVVHINALNALSDRFRITHLCDVSRQLIDHCARKIPGTPPKTTLDPAELRASPDVDAVLICSATACHVSQAITALQHGKHVLVEKPLSICYRDVDALIAAEAKSKGTVFVGYMRRYAPALAAALREIGASEIKYARVRDLIGPNPHFVAQSGTFPQRFVDIAAADVEALKAAEADIERQALETEFAVPMTEENRGFLYMLGLLGTHDLSAMRELLGMPRRVLGAGFKQGYWTAPLDYGGFLVVYESGFNEIPVVDAHLEVYTERKIVRVEYDTPFVKGLPTMLAVRERVDAPDGEGLPWYQDRRVRTTYEDSYTIELREWYDCIVGGKTPKTTVKDAREDVDLIKMILQAGCR